MGVIIPSEIVEEMSIKTGENLTLDIKRKQNVLKELFGTLHTSKKTSKILQETRAELESNLL